MKKNIFILLFSLCIVMKLQAQTITANDETPLSGFMCNSDVFASFTTTGTFNVGNIFTLEVSDQNGDFTTPSVTATTTTVPPLFSSITLTVPLSYPSGNGYLLRVRSSDPVVISDVVPTNMPIVQAPITYTASATPNEVLYGTGTTISLSGSQVGIDYNLRNDLTGSMHEIHYLSPTSGTGGVIDFSTGALTTTTNYLVRADYPASPGAPFACRRETDVVTVTVYSVGNPGTGGRYATIQDAVDAATAGQTIEILANRFYDEDVIVDKNLTFTSSTGNYEDVTIKNIQVNDGITLTIDGNMGISEVLEMQGNAEVIVNTGADFVLRSTETGTAMVVNSGTNTVSGNVITERLTLDPTTIPNFTGTYNGQGYHMFSSPFTSTTATVSQFGDDMNLVLTQSYNTAAEPTYTNPFPTFFKYDEPSSATASPSGRFSAFTMGYKVPLETDDLEVGRGYEVNLATGAVIDLKGQLNNGNITIPLSNTATGFNLIGNPYPSPIKWSSVYNLSTNSANVEPTIYIDIKTGQYAANYATYNALTDMKVNGGQEDIALMQSFFVKAIGTNPELAMNNSVRPTTYENTRFFKTQANEVVKDGVIKLGILSEGNMDETAIGFIEGATSNFDNLYDAQKIHKINGYVSTLYSYNKNNTTSENEYYAINVLPKFDEDMILPLAMNIIKSGKHKIVVREIKYFHSLSNVYLYDSLTETLHDLKANPEYEFVAEANKEVKRFVILFKTDKNFTQKDHIVAYPNPTQTNFSYSLKNDKEGVHTIRLFDVTGKLILERTQDKQGAFLEGTINLETQSKGLYLLQISDSQKTTTVRIVKE
ncbi:T9SS type A sorting domain-containing protein [Bernardetia sp. OM2101]|uniref:T9SS type A sorting domain-containing protein n=1 Tax=Bernardetia sp. OM2101 TaxID=3344876 RepID=UPI0035CF5762